MKEIVVRDPFDDISQFFGGRPLARFARFGDLAVDVFEQDGNVIAKMSIPGIEKDEVEITVDEDTLTIEGSREEEKEVDQKDYYSKEIRRGSFSRTVDLPKIVDGEKAIADYKDGVLTVTMPTVEGEEKKGVKVEIKK